jgi:hypothetical protein
MIMEITTFGFLYFGLSQGGKEKQWSNGGFEAGRS